MEYRILGRTGKKVSLIGMGGIPIQRINCNDSKKVINYALNKGINFFDSARGYTDSEEKMGAVFSKNSNKICIATKSMARTKQEMKKDIEISLKNFGVSCIELYQLHNVKSDEELEKVMSKNGAVQALLEAKKEGKIKHIGITGHIVETLIKAIKTDIFDTVQFPFNAVEKKAAEELIPLANKLDIGTIVMKPLAGGAFKNVGLAIRWLLEYPITTIIPGMESEEQIKQNTYCGKKVVPLTVEEMKDLDEEVQSLGKTFCRRCGYCQPCPQGIDIPTIFILEGYWSRYGLKEWAKERYGTLKADVRDCIECGSCEEKCPYDLPITEMLKDSHNKLS